MRFGRDLHKHQIPEWASSYVGYAELKRLSKFVAKAIIEDKPDVADLLQMLRSALRSDIATVETFYTHFHSLTSFAVDELDLQEAEEVLATCLELRLGIKKLQWYGKVNRDGFSNITEKQRRFPIVDDIDDCKLYKCEFAGQCRSTGILDWLDRAIACLGASFSTPTGASLVLNTIQNDVFDVEDFPVHRIVIRLAQNLSRHIPSTQKMYLEGSEINPDDAKGILVLFTDLLDHLLPHQHQNILQKDIFGRSPLHYASQYGLAEACHIILHRIHVEKASDGMVLAHLVLSPDSEGSTPLHLAVTNGHTATVKSLLEALHIEDIETETLIEMDVCNTLAKLTHIALRSNFTAIVKLLLATCVCDVNYQTERGETAVFVAARSGREDYVKMLIESPGFHELNMNLPENGYGWTPLIVACTQDNQPVIEILLDAGADQSLRDTFGWTARDHAAFRGFWLIGELLAATPSETSARIPKVQLLETNASPPCNAGETRIFVNISTLNTREPKPALDMDPYLTKFSYNPYPETGFSIKISAVGATGSTGLIHLPILNDTTNYPHMFTTKDIHKVKLIFSVFRSKPDIQDGEHIGGAVALLEELKSGLGPDRESLIRSYTIPVLDSRSLEPIGAVTFDFLVVKPFPNPSIHEANFRKIWAGARTQVIGHRGLGQNHPSFRRLQVGENTIQSFLATMGLGVSYIECDVQLTRDHVPIIYHDFLLSESGADLAPHHLSFDQFMHINNIQNTHDILQVPTRDIDSSTSTIDLTGSTKSRSRAHTFDQTTDLRSRSLLERLKHTYEFKLKGFKGNIRGEHIHAPFTTLEEMLRTLPEVLSIDIELKYPMLWEAEDWKMNLYGIELNKFVDATLDKIYNFGGRRNIIFTSFSPELCILLAQKQNQYPVLLLNESNLFPTGDVRASNLQEAIHFARRWNLPGVVMSSEPFVMSPKLMEYVKDAGLLCASFGLLNNDAENAKIQFDKLDAIITDDVNLVANTLKNTAL